MGVCPCPQSDPFAKTGRGRSVAAPLSVQLAELAWRPDVVRSAAWGISVRPSPFAALWRVTGRRSANYASRTRPTTPSHTEQHSAPLSEWTRTPGAWEGDAVRDPTQRVSRQSTRQQVDGSEWWVDSRAMMTVRRQSLPASMSHRTIADGSVVSPTLCSMRSRTGLVALL